MALSFGKTKGKTTVPFFEDLDKIRIGMVKSKKKNSSQLVISNVLL